MIGAIIIAAVSIITMALCSLVAWRWRFRIVPVGWLVFVMMAVGSLSIGAFYIGIFHALYHEHNVLALVPISRAIFLFILIATSLMAVGVLLLAGNGGKRNG